MTEPLIEALADEAWEYLTKKPKADFEDWVELKDLIPGDDVNILLELQKSLGKK